MLMTLKGTPFIYYGEEIGMTNGRLHKNQIADPLGKRFWPFFKGRDRARTPMQWSSAMNAGFSTHTTWLPVNNDYLEMNVSVESRNPDSILTLYRKLIFLRNNNWVAVTKGERGLLAYLRVLGNEKILVLLNFRNRTLTVPGHFPANVQVLLSTHRWSGFQFNPREDKIYPYEATLFRLNN